MDGLVATTGQDRAPLHAADATRCASLLVMVYGAMGASGITGQAINALARDGLALGPAGAASFLALASVPTYLGPLYGCLSDTVPLFGLRRKSYLVAAGALGFVAWTALGSAGRPTFAMALALVAAGLGAMTVSTVVANGLMIDVGRPLALTGALQSAQWAAANAASLVTTAASGFLVQWAGGGAAFRAYAACPLLVAVGSAVLLWEPRISRASAARLAPPAALRAAFTSREQRVVAALLFAWYFSPGLGTALYYYQRGALHFGPGTIGMLGALFAAAGIPAAAVYRRASRRVPPRRIVGASVALGAIGHLSYLGMSGPVSAALSFTIDGALSLFAMLALLDVGARAVPHGAEGTAFAVLASVRAVAALLGGVLGGALYQRIGLHALLILSAACTAACGLLVSRLPDSLEREPARMPAPAEVTP